MSALRATYRLSATATGASARAELLALEQTVELPRTAVPAHLRERAVARVEAVVEDDRGGNLATLAFPDACAPADPAALLNLLFGNASLQPDVELVAVDVPEPLRAGLGGPRHGVAGWRERTGTHGRPLVCTALKPVGLSSAELAALARTFARAGVDVVKDDHGLGEQPSAPFAERVAACQRAVDEVAARTGHRALYAPNLIGPPATLARQLDTVRRAGVRAVLIEPVLYGLPAFWELVRGGLGMPVLAHPAWAGATRAAPPALLGTVLRLLGADAVIFPHVGGRFAYTADTCRALADELRRPLAPLAPALPVPAGGIDADRADEVVHFYGPNAMLLVGGSLYLAGADLERRTRELVERVAATRPS